METTKRKLLTSIIVSLGFAALAIVLFEAYNPGERPQPKGNLVRVMRWNRRVIPGESFRSEDVAPVLLPFQLMKDMPDVVLKGEDRNFVGARLRREVAEGDFLRRSDVEFPLVAATSRPVVDVDPSTLTPMGNDRFLSEEKTAFGGMFDNSSVAVAGAGKDIDMGAMGLGKHLGEVADSVAPAGSKRLSAWRHKIPGGRSDTISYLAPVSLEAATKFYKTRLVEMGYKLVTDKAPLSGDGAAMSFVKGAQQYYYVTLRPTDKDGESKVFLVIARPEAKPARPDGAKKE